VLWIVYIFFHYSIIVMMSDKLVVWRNEYLFIVTMPIN
jgi:hypothetical protein